MKIFRPYFLGLKLLPVHSLYKDYLLLEGQNLLIFFLAGADAELEIALFFLEQKKLWVEREKMM